MSTKETSATEMYVPAQSGRRTTPRPGRPRGAARQGLAGLGRAWQGLADLAGLGLEVVNNVANDGDP